MKKLKSPHPSVSIIDGEPRLNIVANFYIDKRLPKYLSKLKNSKKYSYMPDGGTVYRKHFTIK